MKWQKKLTKTEMRHLKETIGTRPTLEAFRNNRKGQLEFRGAGDIEPCWDCRRIAQKLGIEQ
jgi:hypothetical protein